MIQKPRDHRRVFDAQMTFTAPLQWLQVLIAAIGESLMIF
jgi:hypothetical protein